MRIPSVKTLTSVLSFALVFAAVKYGLEFLFEQHAVTETVEQIKKIKEDGAKKHPELSASAAERLEAVESMTKSLDSETDWNKKQQLAAFSFLGFYIINTSERSAFCSELGVSISSFTVAFERLHVTELAKARKLISGATAQEQKMLTLLKPQFRKSVIEDMADISSSQNIPVKDVCQIFSQQGKAFAQKMHFSKMAPEVYAILIR